MKRHLFTLLRVGVVGASAASLVATLPSIARHMAGVVLLEAPQMPAARAPSQSGGVDVESILTFAPFGRAASAAKPVKAPSDSLPDLRLRGVFAGSTGGSAAMLDVDAQPGVFKLGQVVTQALAVTEILPDRVALSDGSQTLTLRLDDETTEVARAAAAPVPHSATAQLLEEIKTGLVVPARYEKPAPPETTSEYIDYWRGRIRKNPQAVLDEIGLTPTKDGYVVAARHDVGVRLAGLRPGDLVRSVNGLSVGNPDQDRKTYDQIANSGQARLEIERGGRLFTLSFPLREIR